MRVYLLWYTAKNSAEIVDVTKAVEDTLALAPQLQRIVVITSLMDMLKADEVITADNEEQMLDMFKGVNITKVASKEGLH
jgi:hypothetical protein